MIVTLRDSLCIKRIGSDNIGSSLEIAAMNISHHVGTRKAQHIIIAFQLSWDILKTLSPEVFLVKRTNHAMRTLGTQ